MNYFFKKEVVLLFKTSRNWRFFDVLVFCAAQNVSRGKASDANELYKVLFETKVEVKWGNSEIHFEGKSLKS